MLNVVCSEYCSESVVTCFVCKELTLKDFEGIVGDPEGYVNSSAESVVTYFVCKELTLKEFEGSKGQIYQTVKTVQQKLFRFYQFREWTVFSKSPIFMLNVVCSEYCSESVVTYLVCKELTMKEFEGIVGDPEDYVNSSAESVVTYLVCKELTLKEFEGSKGQIYQTVKTLQQKLSKFYQFREWTVFSNSPIFMLIVVCSEYCSESVVTCFVCKDLTLREFEGIVCDPEDYVNSCAESVVTYLVCKELTLKDFEGSKGQIYQTVKTVQQKLFRFYRFREWTVFSNSPSFMLNVVCSEYCSESVVTYLVCKELTMEEFEGSKGQIYQTVKTVQQKLFRFYRIREWTVFSNSPIFMLNVVCSEYCSESVVTCFVCKELTLKEFEGIVGDPEGYVNSSADL